MDGYTFSVERNKRLIAHEQATAGVRDLGRLAELESRLSEDLLALYTRLQGCGGVGLRASSQKPAS